SAPFDSVRRGQSPTALAPSPASAALAPSPASAALAPSPASAALAPSPASAACPPRSHGANPSRTPGPGDTDVTFTTSETAQDRDARFENDRIAYLLKEHGLDEVSAGLRAAGYSVTGRRGLAFA